MRSLFAILITLFVVSCSSKSEESFLKDINETEEQLREMSASPQLNQEEYNQAEKEYIDQLVDFYKEFPKSEKAAECLDKAHMVYSGSGNFDLASKWADTLLEKYPNYANRALVLESQATTYDAIVEPRDSVKVRKYYTQLLKEFPNMDKEKREGIEKRLRNNSLTFDQYIMLQMKDEALAE